MKATNNTELVLGNNEIEISIYSAIESETSFKQVSKCCNSAVNYKKVCSNCLKELSPEEIGKSLAVGDTLKAIDTDKLKLETTSLKILGTIDNDIENGVFLNGDVYFIGINEDKKNKGKTERNLTKYSYLRESLRASSVCLIGLLNTRGKEHIVMLKPYFNGLVGLGLYHFNRIRNIQEIAGYSLSLNLDTNIVKQMGEQLKAKEKIAIKTIENTRDKLLESAFTNEAKKEVKTENPLELCAF
jgi:non-homologous end joining protein Ku